MTDERALVEALETFHREVRSRVKGAKTTTTWILYGTEATYTLDGAPGEGETLEARGWSVSATDRRRDWASYVLCHAGGTLVGHATGRPGRGGRIEEEAGRQHLHQILPDECAQIAAGCRVREAALLGRIALLRRHPLLLSCRLHFHDYLRAVYRIETEEEVAILRDLLAARAGETDLDAFLTEAARLDAAVRDERRPYVYGVEGGRIRVFRGTQKRSRRCVNGWLWGEAAPEEAPSASPTPEKEEEGAYEERTRGAPFHVRLEALRAEAARLVDPADGADLLDLAARAKEGRVAHAWAQAEALGETADIASLDAKRREAARALLHLVERDLRLVAAYGRALAAWGFDLREAAQRLAPALHKLRRKVTAAGG